jgi:hypothetical protein
MAAVMVTNETQSQASRVTKEGKRITYRMHVIQQPERARACGSGAKCKDFLTFGCVATM